MGKVWLVEETGEVRKVKYGEYNRIGKDFAYWNIHHDTDGEYPILKVTEVIEKVVQGLDGKYYHTYEPIFPEPEIKRYEELGAFIHEHQILPDWSLGMAVEGFIETHKQNPEPEYHWIDDWM